MARSRPIHVVLLVIFLAATVDCGSEAIPEKTFLEKLNNLLSLVYRGFRNVRSNVKTLHENFDLIGALETDKLNSTVRALELLQHQREPVAAKTQPDVTTPQLVTTTKTEACGDRWTKYGTSFFLFCTCTQPCTFNDARKTCREKQAELAKSTSREMENFFELSLNTSAYILLGGNDRDEEGTWRWPDGSLPNASYTNWYPGEPNGGKRQNCLEWHYYVRKWYDGSCDHRYSAYDAGFVCEKKLQ